MSTGAKAATFLILTFVLSWSFVGVGIMAGAQNTPSAALMTLTAMMFGPSIAAVACALLFEKGRRVDALGLRFRPNVWWLAAWIFPILVCALSVLVTILATGQPIADPGVQTAAAVEAQAGAEAAARVRETPFLTLIIVGSAVTVGALINAPILTVSEELGWRGYLHHLWRPLGFWRTSLGTGVIWGIWHAPAIYFFGLNYPQNREIGIPLFVLFCTLLSPLMTFVRDRGGSTWAAGIAHGTVNATASLTLLSLSAPGFPWNGVVGIGGYAALALGVAIVAALRPGLARPSTLA